MKFPKSEFWNYSTQIWSLPNIESGCLELQNHHNININILLYCCWAGENNLTLNEDNIQTLLKSAKPWQDIIEPLRKSRKVMQDSLIAIPADKRSQTVANISEMEINTEHMAQLALEKALKLASLKKADDKTNCQCSQHNIDTYINSADNICANDDVSSHINQILNTLFSCEADMQAM